MSTNTNQQVVKTIANAANTYATTAPGTVVRRSETVSAPRVVSNNATYVNAPTTTTYVNAPTTTTYLNAPANTYVNQVVRTSGTTLPVTSTTLRTSANWAGNERRLDELSARILARKVFSKYDANGSGYMNSMETAQLLSDLYASLNVDHPVNREEGLELMYANDSNSDNQISQRDFEDIFVRHISTGDQSGFRLFLDSNTYVSKLNPTGTLRAHQGVTTTYQSSPTSTYVNRIN